MRLTPRQKQFYDQLVELWRSHGQSVHYTAVAEALGVSPSSAYDMLKVLESKNAVASEYVLDGNAPGPGRSAIRFFPVPEALQPAGTHEEPDWPLVMAGLLARLREVRDTNVRDTLNDILSRLADSGSPLSYCSGVVAAHLVNLRFSAREFFSRTRLQALHTLVSNGEAGFGALAGLSIGTSLERLHETPLLEALLQAARGFQSHLAELSVEGRQRLADFLREALSAIETTQA